MKVLLILLLLAGLTTTGNVWAMTSAGFHEVDGEIFDDWQVCRTRPFGDDGFYQISRTRFRPVIAFESLAENTDIAYKLGREFTQKYPDETERAEEIYYFVRDRVRYVPDVDQFELDEFAQNADELATAIDENGVGYGDCEDSAILLAIMYRGAGYRSAIALAPGHTAALVYLPEYKEATALELSGESGWVWAEATGKNNPLGWIPKELIEKKMAAYEIAEEEVTVEPPVKTPVAITVGGGGGGSSSLPFPFFSIIGLLWFISMLRRKR